MEDIEGNGRPCGAGVDLGAHELGNCSASHPFKRGDTDGSGTLDLTDVIQILNYQFICPMVLDCLDAADLNDDGEISLVDAIRSLNYQFLGMPMAVPASLRCGPDDQDDDLPPCQYPEESCR